MHGVRKGVARGVSCPSGKGMAFTSWDAAQAAVKRLDAERAYKCSGCGYYHVTRDTHAEFSAKMGEHIAAAKGCTSDSMYGTVVSYTDEEGASDEDEAHADQQGASSPGSQRAQPGPGGRGPRAATFKRGPASRQPPSPATLAARLAQRSDSGGMR